MLFRSVCAGCVDVMHVCVCRLCGCDACVCAGCGVRVDLCRVAVSMSVGLAASAREQGGGTVVLAGWLWRDVLLILRTWAGLVLEGERAGVGDLGPLHGGDCQHRGGRHLHADHQQHRADRKSVV